MNAETWKCSVLTLINYERYQSVFILWICENRKYRGALCVQHKIVVKWLKLPTKYEFSQNNRRMFQLKDWSFRNSATISAWNLITIASKESFSNLTVKNERLYPRGLLGLIIVNDNIQVLDRNPFEFQRISQSNFIETMTKFTFWSR